MTDPGGRSESGGGKGGRFLPFLLSLTLLYLLYPVMVELDRLQLYRAALGLVLVAAVFTLSGRKRTFLVALTLGVPAMVAQAVAYGLPGTGTALVGAALSLAFLGFTTAVILASVLRPGKVTGDKIGGAISVYLLLGLLWALLYGIVAVLQPGAFRTPEGFHGLAGGEAIGQGGEYFLIYYSFVTLTTLGYGEIAPATAWSQTLAWMEAVSGQLYLAILIARLVGLHIAHTTGPGHA